MRGTTGPNSSVHKVVEPSDGETLVADDRGPFGAKSLSRGSPHLWVLRQRTPSRAAHRPDLAAFDRNAGVLGRLGEG